VKQRFNSLAPLKCAALATVFLVSGCHEDTIIKSSLTPAIDNIHTFGLGPDFNNGTENMPELNMLATTAFQDSVITSARSGFPIYHALGYMQDPFAGRTSASIFAQFVPTAVKVGLTGTVDSLVLVLPYSGFTWGDTTTTSSQIVRVFAINEDFSKDSTYYNYSSKSTDNTLIGTGTFMTGTSGTGAIQDSVWVGKIKPKKQAPHLRIRLDSNWVKNKFLPALAYDTSYAAFLKQFQGLFIVADSAQVGTALPYFRLNSGSASFYAAAALLAYQNGTDSATVQFPYLESFAAHFNRIRRNYVGFPIANLINQTGTPEYLAMQNAPGAVIDLQLPNIHKLPKNVIINKAEITFTQVVAPGQNAITDAKFFAPARLYPQGINTSGGQYTIADRYPINDQSLDFIDGSITRENRNGTMVNVYRLNVPREVQRAIIAGNSGLHLRIGGTVNFPAAYRLVVAGMGSAETLSRPKINIIYSKQ
jgi:hypothetical protein